MADSPVVSDTAIALNRFGLGVRLGDAPPADARAWLLAQFERYEPRPAAWAALAGAPAIVEALGQARRQGAPGNDAGEAVQQSAAKQAARAAVRTEVRDDYRSAVDARVESALATDTPFVERLVHFWSNHFAVSTEKPQVAALAGAFEAEAIRPHVLGRFEDMLLAVERHPAMQIFLDQVRSVGPDSTAAMRADARDPEHKHGLNENLAREIMELHTLGVRTGYTQDDVTEFARALTGWSIVGAQGRGGAPGSFVFRQGVHEPGERTIMGRRYGERGEAQALAVLHDLAAAPATARHIAGKLARHFVADNPSEAMIAQLAHTFETTDGDLPSVYRALVAAREAWTPVATKFKTPWDWTISALRGLGLRSLGNVHAAPMLTQLGQPVWRPGSPAGYDDNAASWAAPDALVRRVELAQRMAARVGDRVDPRTLGPILLAGAPSQSTTLAVARAESVPTALALLLVSPEFQRR
ncbi:DUF1800 domain-containing protein [Trinickia fusca]|uniref:DUF1800 domain-containing protein n=1 Tax=Trinickia fusca TaxID=2419777 RepID=A0A494XJX8_9BURK|nr:DUF1800 domain-containing protein [Trinickia fusca]RKP50888.1 DUF1800 domain-containing protein [Trinickia fusca]